MADHHDRGQAKSSRLLLHFREQCRAKAYLDTLFGSDTEVVAESRKFVFRYKSPKHWSDVFGTYYGPVLKAFAALDPKTGKALEADLSALLDEFNVANDGTLVVPDEYLEVVITKK